MSSAAGRVPPYDGASPSFVEELSDDWGGGTEQPDRPWLCTLTAEAAFELESDVAAFAHGLVADGAVHPDVRAQAEELSRKLLRLALRAPPAAAQDRFRRPDTVRRAVKDLDLDRHLGTRSVPLQIPEGLLDEWRALMDTCENRETKAALRRAVSQMRAVALEWATAAPP